MTTYCEVVDCRHNVEGKCDLKERKIDKFQCCVSFERKKEREVKTENGE